MTNIRRWLWVVFLCVFGMVIIGGITRLTGSGLSMVEWHPLMGALPPLSEEAWQHTFSLYQRSPQYAQVNHWMQLEDFKRIFFWEYLHRLSGRLIGLIVFFPWLVMTVRKRISGKLLRATGIMFLLGGAQGVMGWLMVRSGLVDRPSVSHFRLAAHLLLAFVVAMWTLWMILDLSKDPRDADVSADGRSEGSVRTRAALAMRRLTTSALLLVTLQVVYGAFTAGTHAGLVSSTFPDMNGTYSPVPFVHDLSALFHEAGAIHYAHRFIALVFIFLVAAMWRSSRSCAPEVKYWTHVVVGVATAQITLGALTVVYMVPIWAAVMHQGMAFVLVSVVVTLAYRLGLIPRRSLGKLGKLGKLEKDPKPQD